MSDPYLNRIERAALMAAIVGLGSLGLSMGIASAALILRLAFSGWC